MEVLFKFLTSRLSSKYLRTVQYNAKTTPILLQKSYVTESTENRYREKLLKKARQHGFKTIEEFKLSQKSELEAKKASFNSIDYLKELEDYEQHIKTANNKILRKDRGSIDVTNPPKCYKTLDSFLNLEKVRNLNKQELEFLWRAKWMNKENTLNAIVPIDVWANIGSYASKNPVFVLPLRRKIEGGNEEKPKEQGIEMHYLQWNFVGPNTVYCMITSLAHFKLHKDFSRPHTTFQFHLDLANEKKIVFMNGQVETDSNVSLQDAQIFLLNIQKFYGAIHFDSVSARRRFKLLQDFTNGSSDFDFNLLISLTESLQD